MYPYKRYIMQLSLNTFTIISSQYDIINRYRIPCIGSRVLVKWHNPDRKMSYGTITNSGILSGFMYNYKVLLLNLQTGYYYNFPINYFPTSIKNLIVLDDWNY